MPKVDPMDEHDKSHLEHILEAAAAAGVLAAAARKPIEEIVPSEHVEEFGHAVTSEVPEEMVTVDTAVAVAPVPDHVDERPGTCLD